MDRMSSGFFLLVCLISVGVVESRPHKAPASPISIPSTMLLDAGETDNGDDDGDDDTEDSKEESAADQEQIKEETTKAQKDAEAALEAAMQKQERAKRKVADFEDDKTFNAKIAKQTELITKETESPALSKFLGSFRTEMRQYAMPTYPQYLQGKLDEANKKVITLEAKLHKQNTNPTKPETEAKTKPKATTEAKKDAESSAEADAKEVAQAAGEVWAISFLANVVLLTAVFAMASAANSVVQNYTWFLIDQVVAIFLAVMYFQAFDSLLDFHGLDVQNATIASILHAVAMLSIVLGVAAALRKQQVALAILCGSGAHIVSFSSIHAAAAAQNSLLGLSYTYSTCIFGLITLGLALGIIGFLVFSTKKVTRLNEDDNFMDKTDDVENDFGSMAFSVVFTMFMRFILTGHHPVDDDTEFDHNKEQRTAMLIYAIACLILAGFVVTICSRRAAATNNYAIKRVMTFFSTVTTMNVAWAWLYWGEWEFFEALYPGDAIKGRVMFAIVMSIVGGIGLLGLSKIGASKVERKTEKKVALTALGLVVAWSWELCFDAAVDTMCEDAVHPVGLKVAATLSLAAIIIPVYAIYMKPIAMRAAEAIGA